MPRRTHKQMTKPGRARQSERQRMSDTLYGIKSPVIRRIQLSECRQFVRLIMGPNFPIPCIRLSANELASMRHLAVQYIESKGDGKRRPAPPQLLDRGLDGICEQTYPSGYRLVLKGNLSPFNKVYLTLEEIGRLRTLLNVRTREMYRG